MQDDCIQNARTRNNIFLAMAQQIIYEGNLDNRFKYRLKKESIKNDLRMHQNYKQFKINN